MKLELKHIAPYLPYGLRIAKGLATYRDIYSKIDISRQFNDSEGLEWDTVQRLLFEESWKPLLLPMSSLYTEMEDGKVPIVELAKMLGDFKELISISVDDNCTDELGNRAPYYECKYVSNIDEDIHSTLVFCPDTVSFERMIIYNAHITRPVSSSDFKGCPIRCYNQFYEYLFQHHFDVYGLIDKGLALDKTKIK